MQTFAITKIARKITILRKEEVYFVCFMDNKKFHCREIAKSDGAAHNVALFLYSTTSSKFIQILPLYYSKKTTQFSFISK